MDPKKFKGTNALRGLINPTRVPIEQKESLRWLQNVQQSSALLGEPGRCVHIGDRESDIYELFCAAHETGAHFLLRPCVNRLAKAGTTTVEEVMAEVPVKGLHRIEVRDTKGAVTEAVLELKVQRMQVLPPVAKQGRYPALILTIIHATERVTPKRREKIEWKLVTNLPVTTRQDVIEKLGWYALRWKIEVFHKILKSGCKVEASGLRTAERLVNLIATCCILAWRIFWMTMVNRVQPEADPASALSPVEIEVLDGLIRPQSVAAPSPRTLALYLTQIARLGGYLGRARDPAPGNIVMWRGLARLTDIVLGAFLRAPLAGN